MFLENSHFLFLILKTRTIFETTGKTCNPEYNPDSSSSFQTLQRCGQIITTPEPHICAVQAR